MLAAVHILLFTVKAYGPISPYTLFYYDKWGYYTLSKNTRGWYTAYTRVRLYTPNAPLEPVKNLGGLGKIWGPVPPGPA